MENTKGVKNEKSNTVQQQFKEGNKLDQDSQQ